MMRPNARRRTLIRERGRVVGLKPVSSNHESSSGITRGTAERGEGRDRRRRRDDADRGSGTRARAVRLRGLGRLARFGRRARHLWVRALSFCPLWLACFLAIATWSLLPSGGLFAPELEVGSIAGRTVVADRALSITDDVGTQALVAEARANVPPVYDFDRPLEERRRTQLAALFEAGRGAEDQPEGETTPGSIPEPEAVAPEAFAERLAAASGLRVTPDQAMLLQALAFAPEIEDRLGGEMARVLRTGVVSDKDLLLENRALGITLQMLPTGERKTQLDLYGYLDYPDEARETVLADLRLWNGLDGTRRRTLAAFLIANLGPNLTPNNSETLALRDRAAAEVGTVTRTFPAGQVLVRKGDQVDDITARALAQMAGSDDLRARLLTLLGTVLLVGAVALFLWLGLARDGTRDRPLRRLFNESLLLLSMHLLGIRLALVLAEAIGHAIEREPFGRVESYVFAVPFATLALIGVLLYGRHVALLLSLAFAVVAARLGGVTEWSWTIYALAGSLAAIFALDTLSFKQRAVTSQAGAVVGLVNVGSVLVITALDGVVEGVGRLGFDAGCALVGGLLAASITSFCIPVLEGLLGITTHIKLIELTNPNLPLLRRLALEAPGSFQHSLAVANLAKAGCEAIGADAVLVHTAALYHDVGKIARPHYFIENQAPGQNPHDKIQPSMSALILINHVKEGLDLAERYHLPVPLRDAIGQHHGTRLISFFYNRAKTRCDPDTEAVREDEFRYPGPKPQTKEMGILMLADAVEAASRTLVEPNRQQLRALLRQIFDDTLGDHQLDHTDLTLSDLRQAEDAFLRVLTNIYHRRVDYPGFDFNQPRRRKTSTGTFAAASRKAS